MKMRLIDRKQTILFMRIFAYKEAQEGTHCMPLLYSRVNRLLTNQLLLLFFFQIIIKLIIFTEIGPHHHNNRGV